VPRTVNTVTGANVNAHLTYAVTYRLNITKVTRLHLPQANPNSGLGHFVTKTVQLFRHWLKAILALVSEEFYHRQDCTL
jgi:hypothetical protein